MAATGYTKGDILQLAFEELGIGNYVFDLEPDQQVAALNRMDNMMNSPPWNGLGYAQPVTAGGSLPTDLPGVGEAYVEAIYTNLAVRLAPTIGKTVSAETRKAARQGLNYVATVTAKRTQVAMSSRTPRGGGNRFWGWGNYFAPTTAADTSDAVTSNWVLVDGVWVDTGQWDNNEVWEDA